MNRFGNVVKPMMWSMSLLLSALVAGCDHGGGGTGSTVAGGVCSAGAACVNLGAAGGTFVILSTAGITNTGGHTTAITGNIGTSPIAGSAMDGVFCSEIAGSIIGVDATYTGSGDVSCYKGSADDKTMVDNAVLDATAAFGDADSRAPGVGKTDLFAGDITGQNLTPGVYKWSTGVSINGPVTFTGSATDVWVLQIAGSLTQANATMVTLAGGALPKNIFWRTAGVAAIGTTATFQGILMSDSAITLATGAVANGRLYAASSVTLDANAVTRPALF